MNEKHCDALKYNMLFNQKRELEYQIDRLQERLDRVNEELEECKDD